MGRTSRRLGYRGATSAHGSPRGSLDSYSRGCLFQPQRPVTGGIGSMTRSARKRARHASASQDGRSYSGQLVREAFDAAGMEIASIDQAANAPAPAASRPFPADVYHQQRAAFLE